MKLCEETKYNIDDKVFILVDEHKYKPCGRCSGEGELKLVIGGTVSCDECRGSKIDSDKWFVHHTSKKVIIDEIGVHHNKEEGTFLVYWGKDESGFDVEGFKEDECFSTLELAETECEKRNDETK